ncbi:hypothetical protein BS78_01G379100 [Paspalum vaginatum]|nr:hypothetical protein BS78_01G379100 [Paspalum vaginatum]
MNYNTTYLAWEEKRKRKNEIEGKRELCHRYPNPTGHRTTTAAALSRLPLPQNARAPDGRLAAAACRGAPGPPPGGRSDNGALPRRPRSAETVSRSDLRSIIPLEEFGFTDSGVLELNVSGIAFDPPPTGLHGARPLPAQLLLLDAGRLVPGPRQF